MIEHMLEDLKDSRQEKKLIGFREEGRVMVFNRASSKNDAKRVISNRVRAMGEPAEWQVFCVSYHGFRKHMLKCGALRLCRVGAFTPQLVRTKSGLWGDVGVAAALPG